MKPLFELILRGEGGERKGRASRYVSVVILILRGRYLEEEKLEDDEWTRRERTTGKSRLTCCNPESLPPAKFIAFGS